MQVVVKVCRMNNVLKKWCNENEDEERKRKETVSMNKKEGKVNILQECRPSKVCTVVKQTLDSFTLLSYTKS